MRQYRKQTLTLSALAAALLLAFAPPAAAATTGVVTTIVTNPLTGIALDGMDPVSYFTDEEPQQGTPAFEVVWGGVSWYFATEANREVFVRAPEIYAPQFGGHCPMGLARGYLSDGNPSIYLVINKRLYLFYSTGNKDAFQLAPETAILGARAAWPELQKALSTH